jgi:hypothetical protein
MTRWILEVFYRAPNASVCAGNTAVSLTVSGKATSLTTSESQRVPGGYLFAGMHGSTSKIGPVAAVDSLDAVEIIMSVEMDYGIDSAEINFDLTLLDWITAIADLIDRHAVNA